MKAYRLVLPTLLGLALAAVLLGAAVRQSRAALETDPSNASPTARSSYPVRQTNSPLATVRYVATSGVDTGACTDSANPCHTVQYAVDRAAMGDEVRVAAGTYTDILIRPRLDIITTGYVTQVVYITKTVSIQGGFSLADWTTPDPSVNLTILDAQGLGRVVYIAGLISPTVEGFQITGGDSTGLGGFKYPYSPWEEDAGGGIYIHGAAALISNVQVISNTSPQYGGGIHLSYSTATVRNNSLKQNRTNFQHQTRYGSGGGLSSYEGKNTIIGNVFSSNLSVYSGGGIYQIYGEAVVRENKFFSNTALGYGAGLHLENINCEVTGNQIIANTALDGSGGGIHVRDSVIALKNNIIHGNSLPNSNGGGGIYAESSDLIVEGNNVSENYSFATGGILLSNINAHIVNNIIVGNDSLYNAAGIMIWAVDGNKMSLRHNTIARNFGDFGAGVGVATGHVTLTNNIIVSQTIGVAYNGEVVLESTLWGAGDWANGQDWAGNGTIIIGTVNVWGDPGFVDPHNGNYHLHQGSAALDAGVDAGVYRDIDAEPRPAGDGFDIGADELQGTLSLALLASPDPVASGGDLTYTLLVTNTGSVDLTAAVTLTLPDQVTPGGVRSWTATLPVTGGAWSQAVAVTVDGSYAGPLTATLQASSPQGARGATTSKVTVMQPAADLQASSSSPTALGGATAFTATVSAGSSVSFAWDFGDGASGSGQHPTHIYPAADIYTASVTASNPVSSVSQQVSVIVQEAIAGLSAASSSPTELGSATIFSATISAGSNVRFAWDFRDGTVGDGQHATHIYPAVGVYTATVTASNLVSQAEASTSGTVSQSGYRLYLPVSLKTHIAVPSGAVETRPQITGLARHR